MTRRQKYFLKQKVLGVLLLALLVGLTIELDGNLTPAVCFGPIAITLIISKDMILTDSYYFDVKEGKIQEDEES